MKKVGWMEVDVGGASSMEGGDKCSHKIGYYFSEIEEVGGSQAGRRRGQSRIEVDICPWKHSKFSSVCKEASNFRLSLKWHGIIVSHGMAEMW